MKNKILTKSILLDLYANRQLSMKEIGILFRINSGTIFGYLRKFGIPTRSKKEAAKNGNLKKTLSVDIERIRKLAARGLCIQEISEKMNVKYHNIYNRVKKYNIKTPTTSKRNAQIRRTKADKKITKKQLKRLYYKKKMTLKEIGQAIGVTAAAVLERMRNWNLKTRSNSEANKLLYIQNPQKREQARINRINTMKKAHYGTKTDIEKLFEYWANEVKIKFETQKQVLPNGHQYDFYIKGTNILVEVDGDYWHSLIKQKTKDRRFEREARKNGFRVFRFARSKILKTKTKCFNRLLKVIT